MDEKETDGCLQAILVQLNLYAASEHRENFRSLVELAQQHHRFLHTAKEALNRWAIDEATRFTTEQARKGIKSKVQGQKGGKGTKRDAADRHAEWQELAIRFGKNIPVLD